MEPVVRGLGVGRRLVEEALDFSRSAGYSSVFLWTVRGLEAATSLYESRGFLETEEKTYEIWGGSSPRSGTISGFEILDRQVQKTARPMVGRG